MKVAGQTTSFFIDQPTSWAKLSRCLVIRGWCFANDLQPIRGIRLRTAELTLFGVVHLPRPDVKAIRPDAPGNNTGFEIRGTLPAGTISLALEAQLADGSWTQVTRQEANVQRRRLPLWLSSNWEDLMLFQMPTHMAYPPRAVKLEQFPPAGRRLRQPKLSLVTPSYQQAPFLEETMRSVFEQGSGLTCEYVVQDGGSNDGSVELIRKNACALHAWSSAPDNGQADAILKGFAQTAGGPEDLMAWINSDDFYLPGTLAFVVDFFARHPDVDVLYGHRVVVDERSREIARWFLPPHDEGVLRLNDFVPQETLFWRRRIWDRVGGVDPSFKFAMDWDLLLRFQAADARMVRVPYFLACFRVHADQKTSVAMHDCGQKEITLLRERAQGRSFPPQEPEKKALLLRYLQKSAWIEFLWRRIGWRAS